MGSWLALNQFKYFKNQIKGFVGIGSAPEFLTRLMWNKFPQKNKTRNTKKRYCKYKKWWLRIPNYKTVN